MVMTKLKPVESLPKNRRTNRDQVIQCLTLKPSTKRLAERSSYELGMTLSTYIEHLIRSQYEK
jgi:hypothetical protein